MRLRHHLPAIFMVLVTLASQLPAQKEHAKWYFGLKAGLDFLTNPPTVLNNSAMNASGACLSISDQAGQLLFYAHGTTIWNKSHLPMANGTGILGNGAALNRLLSTRKPGSDSLFYVFTVGNNQPPFRYSVVDMSLAAGQGSVTLKNLPVTTATVLQNVCGAYHCNGVDHWIVTQEKDSGTFLSFLVTSAGLNTVAVTSSVGANYNGTFGGMKISPSSNKLAVSGRESGSHSIVELFNFNATSGTVSSPIILYQGTLSPQSVEFSPDASKLYMIGEQGPTLMQWDLCAGDSAAIVLSKTIIPISQYEGALQLNENGKIYIAQPPLYHLGVINDPNNYGTACNFVFSGPSTGGNMVQSGLPNYFLRHKNRLDSFSYAVVPALGCHALSFTSSSEPTVSCAASNFAVIGTSWLFGDPGSGTANTSQLKHPVHQYPAAGQYTVKQVFHYPCGSDTITQVVTVPPPNVIISASPGCGSSGTASANVQGGVGPFSFIWTPSQKMGPVAGGLATGVHTVTVFDQGLACSAKGTVAVTNATVPVIQIHPSTLVAVCMGKNAKVGISTVADSYAVQPAAGIAGVGTGSLTISSPSPQLYTVTAISSSCSSQAFFSLALVPLPQASVVASRSAACAQSTILITGSGGTSYLWQLPDNTFATGAAITPTLPDMPGTVVYGLTVNDHNGCESQATASVEVVAMPSGHLPGFITRACAPHCATYSFSTSQSASAIKSSWQLHGTTYASPFSFCLSSAGTYTLTGYLVDTATHCAAITHSNIILFPKPVADFSFDPPEITELFTDVLFTAMYNSTVRKNTWHFSAGTGTHTQLGKQASQVFGEAGTYPVTLLVEDYNGCADTITKPIVVRPPDVFYVPDAFTPNHDGRNEVFRPVISNVKNYQLSIYDRWGQKLFETNDLTSGWDGSYLGQSCKQDSYVWMVRFLNKNGLQTKSGRILLLR